MANILSTEKSSFINKQIEIYSKNKLGQYSKYLQKNPIFVTYYSINQVKSRADIGTGGIETEIGKNSPIRFNKINNFPLYNIPDLKPSIEYDETGMDMNMDISDVVILPNTVKPISQDYVLIKLPGSPEMLYRVNMYTHNTIQSNDFYSVDLDIKRLGEDLEAVLESQVVESYECIFENIGTEDKCLIESSMVDKLQNIKDLFFDMLSYYKGNYYQSNVSNFLLPPYYSNDHMIEPTELYISQLAKYDFKLDGETIKYSHEDYLDIEYEYVENSSQIPGDEDLFKYIKLDINENIISVSIDTDKLPLHWTVSDRETTREEFLYDMNISKFINHSDIFYDETNNKTLVLTMDDIVLSGFEYTFQQTLLYAILHRDIKYLAKNQYYNTLGIQKQYSPMVRYRMDCVSVKPIPSKTELFQGINLIYGQYYPTRLINSILNKSLHYACTDVEKLIFNYIYGIQEDIDSESLALDLFNISLKSYMFLPIVLYILKKLYEEYFS